jgi:O-antigen/teichoic acid export membrane protein
MSETAPAPESSLPRRFLANINYVFVCALTSNTIGFFNIVLLARALNKEGLGEATLYQAVVGLGYAFFNLGIGPAVFYFVVRKEINERQAMEAGLSVTLLAAAATAIGVVIAAVFFGGELETRDIPYALAVLAIPAFLQLRIAEGLLRAQGRFGAMNVLEVALPVSIFVALVGVDLTAGLTVSRSIWAMTLAYIPPLVLGYALVGPSLWPRSLGPLSMLIKSVRFGGQSQLTNLLLLANYRLDIFLVQILVGTAGVGVYRVASTQAEGLWLPANSIAIVLLTNITAGDVANSARLTPVVCRNTLLITAIAAVVAALIAGFWIPVVFTAEYSDSVLPYLWLLPGIVALSASKILSAYVFSRGRPIINAWIALAALVATIPTDIVLIALFGVPGAAMGTTLGYIFSLTLTAIAYQRLSGGSVREALLPRPPDAEIYLNALRTARARLRRKGVQEAVTS